MACKRLRDEEEEDMSQSTQEQPVPPADESNDIVPPQRSASPAEQAAAAACIMMQSQSSTLEDEHYRVPIVKNSELGLDDGKEKRACTPVLHDSDEAHDTFFKVRKPMVGTSFTDDEDCIYVHCLHPDTKKAEFLKMAEQGNLSPVRMTKTSFWKDTKTMEYMPMRTGDKAMICYYRDATTRAVVSGRHLFKKLRQQDPGRQVPCLCVVHTLPPSELRERTQSGDWQERPHQELKSVENYGSVFEDAVTLTALALHGVRLALQTSSSSRDTPFEIQIAFLPYHEGEARSMRRYFARAVAKDFPDAFLKATSLEETDLKTPPHYQAVDQKTLDNLRKLRSAAGFEERRDQIVRRIVEKAWTKDSYRHFSFADNMDGDSQHNETCDDTCKNPICKLIRDFRKYEDDTTERTASPAATSDTTRPSHLSID